MIQALAILPLRRMDCGSTYMMKSGDLPMATQSAQALLVDSKKSSANRNIFQLLAIQDDLFFLNYG
jgi:hypothetical protein